MKSSSQRVQRRRDKLRAAGLRPVQIWIPDTRAPGFAAECERQCPVVAGVVDAELDSWLDQANMDLAEDLDLRDR